MSIPKAFISYSHDTLEHKQWVLNLAIRLRNNGIDAILDQWDLGPGADIPAYMEQNLVASDFTLMVCTQKYVEKANTGVGGVGYEKMIVTSSMMKNIDEKKVIPIIRQQGTYDVPTFLKSKLFVDFSLEDNFEYEFDNLLRALHGAAILSKPKLGSSPFTDSVPNKEWLLNDNVKKVLSSMATLQNRGIKLLTPQEIAVGMDSTIIFVEYALDILSKKGYVEKISNYWELSIQGKYYVIENNLT